MPPKSATSSYKSADISWNGYHLTSGDVARLLQVDLKTVHNWVSRGHVAGRRTEGRHLRFARSEIVRFLREFGYPVPNFLGGAPPRVVIDATPAEVRRALSRGFDTTCCEDLFSCALAVADGTHEAVVVDVDSNSKQQLTTFVHALRSWPSCRQVCIVGVGANAAACRQLLRVGGDVCVEPTQTRELRSVIRWLVGAQSNRPSAVATS